MAKAEISVKLLEDLLFGYTPNPVRIIGIEGIEQLCTDRYDVYVFDIEGPDVPAVDKVDIRCSKQANRAGQELVSMTFVAREAPTK